MVQRNAKGQFVPGQTGNPSGRPKGKRALTVLLEEAGERAISLKPRGSKEEVRVARKEVLAELAWELVLNGHVILMDGTKLKLPAQEWMSLYKWIFTHIDGPARAELDVSTDGKLEIEVSYVQSGIAASGATPEAADNQE
jgi:hypothetical protein